MSSVVCPECGARLAEGSERCDLCGSPIPDAEPLSEPEPDDIPEPETDMTEAEPTGVYCNECGWKNPVGAKFCSRCGEKLQESAANPGPDDGGRIEDASKDSRHPGGAGGSPPREGRSNPRDAGGRKPSGGGETSAPESESVVSTDRDVTRYVAVLIGLAVLVVVALYLITVVSKQQVSAQTDVVQAPADVRSSAVINEYEAIPIAEQYAPTVDSLRRAAAEADGEERHQTRRRLVAFLLDIGRIDRAAIEQQRLAGETDVIEDWRSAANLLFDWMERVNSERKTDVALLTIDAYERVLEEHPNDLDARADLGWAYQYDPQNPMQAIQHTNQVLQEAPNHLVANYNRGVFLLRINRVEDAIAQFEKVKDIAGEESPYFRQADAWIESIRRRQGAG